MSDESWDDLIAKAKQEHRYANLEAMKATGFPRKVHLAFALFFAWISDEARDARDGGKDG